MQDKKGKYKSDSTTDSEEEIDSAEFDEGDPSNVESKSGSLSSTDEGDPSSVESKSESLSSTESESHSDLEESDYQDSLESSTDVWEESSASSDEYGGRGEPEGVPAMNFITGDVVEFH